MTCPTPPNTPVDLTSIHQNEFCDSEIFDSSSSDLSSIVSVSKRSSPLHDSFLSHTSQGTTISPKAHTNSPQTHTISPSTSNIPSHWLSLFDTQKETTSYEEDTEPKSPHLPSPPPLTKSTSAFDPFTTKTKPKPKKNSQIKPATRNVFISHLHPYHKGGTLLGKVLFKSEIRIWKNSKFSGLELCVVLCGRVGVWVWMCENILFLSYILYRITLFCGFT
jgi:hypothetical protein